MREGAGTRRHQVDAEVLGPWSITTSRAFWEGFSPSALDEQRAGDGIRTVFRVEADWSRAEVEVTQRDDLATISVVGDGDLEAAARQVRRFLSLDVDARGWPAVADRDPVIADAQARLPGLRPCGFHSPYEAAAWSVLSLRIRIVQAARLRSDLIHRHGDDGAFPAPRALRALDFDLPGRKTEYLHAVADAALDGRLDGDALRAVDPERAMRSVQDVLGLGPFAAELVVLRGANAPDALPHRERRLDAEIVERYGPDRTLAEVSEAWRPYRTWAAVHLRAARATHPRDRRGSTTTDIAKVRHLFVDAGSGRAVGTARRAGRLRGGGARRRSSASRSRPGPSHPRAGPRHSCVANRSRRRRLALAWTC